jgi:hypothetical protein
MRAWIITGSALGGKYVSMSNYKGWPEEEICEHG